MQASQNNIPSEEVLAILQAAELGVKKLRISSSLFFFRLIVFIEPFSMPVLMFINDTSFGTVEVAKQCVLSQECFQKRFAVGILPI